MLMMLAYLAFNAEGPGQLILMMLAHLALKAKGLGG